MSNIYNLYNFISTKNEIRLRNENKKEKREEEYFHFKILEEVLEKMKERGFEVGSNKRIDKDFPILSKDHFEGIKGDLKFEAERYPSGFSIIFFQDVKTEHKISGKYDYDNYELAPYILKLNFKNEIRKISKFIQELGVNNTTKQFFSLSEDKIKQHFVESWHHPQKDLNFSLSDLDGTTNEHSFNQQDRDRKTIFNGEIKYFRDRKGRLKKGKVYHNINNMWWVILDKHSYTNMASFELFDIVREEDRERKLVNKLRTERLNPNSHRYHNKEYRIGDNLFIINERTGLFKANTDFGNYSHNWCVNSDYRKFLINLRNDKSYFLNKVAHDSLIFDFDSTIKKWKKELREMKKDGSLSKEESKEIIQWINDNIYDYMDSDLVQHLFFDYISEYVNDSWEVFSISKKYDRKAEEFWKLFGKFVRELKREEKKEEKK